MYERVKSAIYHDDEGVSPVIAVILMVAITVVLAATVYVWVSGFASEDTGPEQASATARGAQVGGNDVNWIRVSLTEGANAPYGEEQVSYTVLGPTGASFNPNKTDAASPGDDVLCTQAKAESSSNVAWCDEANDNAEFHDGTVDDGVATNTAGGTDDNNEWDVGQVLYVPCQDSGDHSVTISVRGTTVLDTTVKCDTTAPS